MSTFINSRKTTIALVIAVALIAIVVPTCRMVGCSMDGGYMGFLNMADEFGMLGTCGGEYQTSTGPESVVPAGLQALLLSLVAAIAAVALVLAPRVETARVVVADSAPPPPPEDPRGERFRV